MLEFSVFPWLSLLFIQRHLVDLLEQCAKYLEREERYEVMGEVFKPAIPIYEQERDFRVRRGFTVGVHLVYFGYRLGCCKVSYKYQTLCGFRLP